MVTDNDRRVFNTVHRLIALRRWLVEKNEQWREKRMPCCPWCAFGAPYARAHKRIESICEALARDSRNHQLAASVRLLMNGEMAGNWPEGSFCKVNLDAAELDRLIGRQK